MPATIMLIQKSDGSLEILRSDGSGRAEVSSISEAVLTSRALLAPTAQHSSLAVQDASEHKAAGVNVSIYQEKTALIYAAKNCTPGDLSVWVELSHDDTDENYIQLGEKKTFDATGKAIIAFTAHSIYSRVVAQAASADASNYWILTTMLLGKT